jgi:hypothetical protein
MSKKGVWSMKSYQHTTIFLATAVLLGLLNLPPLSFAMNRQQPMTLFKGLQFVHVMVAPLDEKTKNRGFDARRLGTETERQLQKAGIKILSTEEYDRVRMSKSYPVVRLEMSVSIEEINLEGLKINVDQIVIKARQSAFLTLNPRISLLATTWERRRINYNSNKEETWQILRKLVDEFIGDYRSANPK